MPDYFNDDEDDAPDFFPNDYFTSALCDLGQHVRCRDERCECGCHD